MNAPNNEGAGALVASEQPELQVIPTSSAALILDGASMDSMMRLAEVMAKGRATIPEHLRGNTADCAAVVMQAIQWKMNPFAVAQKTHLVNGTLGYEAQLVNAVIQSSGVTQDRFQYEWYGPWENIIGKTKVVDVAAKGKPGDKDYKKAYQFRAPDYDMRAEEGLGVRVSATLKGESQPRVLDLLLVQASVRNSPLWATDPKQQLAYLAVKRWTRLHAPDVILGVYSPDELEEINREMRDITPTATAAADVMAGADELLKQAQAAAAKGLAAYQQFWSETGAANRKALATHHEALKGTAEHADRMRTVDAEPIEAQSDSMAGLIADMEAAADGGPEALLAAWESLSDATRQKLQPNYAALLARAEAVGVTQ